MLLAGAWWLEAFAMAYAAAKPPALVAEFPTGRLLAGGTVSFDIFAVGWVLFGIASVRARGFPRDAALLLVIGGGIGVLIAVVPGAGRRWRWRWRGWAPGCSGRIVAAKSDRSLRGDAEPAGGRPWRDRDRDRDRLRRPAGCPHALLRPRPRGRCRLAGAPQGWLSTPSSAAGVRPPNQRLAAMTRRDRAGATTAAGA
jgi:hypothetical protein